MSQMRKRPAKQADQERLPPEEARQRTFARAVKLLSAKPRSVAELRERLLERRWASEKDVDDAIERLKEYGYLDDERFAFGYASLRIRERPLGKNRLARDLHFKKVDRAVADEALELVFNETSEEDLIDRAIEKRLRVRGKPTTAVEAKKLFDHLLRLGFPFDLVREKVRAVARSEVDESL
jgi:regulatory protein